MSAAASSKSHGRQQARHASEVGQRHSTPPTSKEENPRAHEQGAPPSVAIREVAARRRAQWATDSEGRDGETPLHDRVTREHHRLRRVHHTRVISVQKLGDHGDEHRQQQRCGHDLGIHDLRW